MTDPKKKLADSLPEADKRFYSVNFLLATFSPVKDPGREERIRDNKLPSRHYQSGDFSIMLFGKHISTPLSRFPPLPEDDEIAGE
jgi:hypothetical protein